MKNVKRYLSLYWEFSKQNLKAMMEYKGNFVIGIVSSLVMQLSGIITIWIIIEQINEIYNWGFYEIAFLYSLVAIVIMSRIHTQTTCENNACDNSSPFISPK